MGLTQDALAATTIAVNGQDSGRIFDGVGALAVVVVHRVC